MNIKLGIVGPCASGKSTISKALQAKGYFVRHIAQEHSYVSHMWQRIAKPDILIFLDVSYQNSCLRRNLNWTREEYDEQVRRLEHARQHAHIYINTNSLLPEQVISIILEYIHLLASK